MILYHELCKFHIITTQISAVVHAEGNHRHRMLHIQVDQITGIGGISIFRTLLRIERCLIFGTTVVHITAASFSGKIQVIFFARIRQVYRLVCHVIITP